MKMVDLTNLILFVVFVLFIYLLYVRNKKSNFPPGPKGWPLIGNFNVNFEKLHEVFIEYGKKYGSIFYFKLGLGGQFDTIVLNDIDAVEEALVKNQNDFSGRGYSWMFDQFSMGGKDVVAADYGPEFKNRKNLASKCLRQFLSGKILETKVNNAISLSLKYWEDHATNKEPFDPNDDLSFIIQNVICGMVFSKQYDFDDEERKRLMKINHEINDIALKVTEEFLPKFVTKIWRSPGGKKFIELNEELWDYYRKSIKEHQAKFDPLCPPSDIVDYLLLIQNDPGEEVTKLDDDELLQLCNDLFLAGTDTTITTLTWLLLFLAVHQDAQEKAYDEIKNTIGTENDIKTTDQTRMPYCKAFQMESMRLGMAAALGVPHKAICDTKLGGFDIPKNMTITVNHYALHHDPREWENPEKFCPERFLEEDGTIKPKPRSWLPFSAGRRACVGENVARSEVFIVWVSILQKFKISLPKGDQPSLAQRLTPPTPHPYKIIIELRE